MENSLKIYKPVHPVDGDKRAVESAVNHLRNLVEMNAAKPRAGHGREWMKLQAKELDIDERIFEDRFWRLIADDEITKFASWLGVTMPSWVERRVPTKPTIKPAEPERLQVFAVAQWVDDNDVPTLSNWKAYNGYSEDDAATSYANEFKLKGNRAVVRVHRQDGIHRDITLEKMIWAVASKYQERGSVISPTLLDKDLGKKIDEAHNNEQEEAV